MIFDVLEIIERVLANAMIVAFLFFFNFWDSEPVNPIRRYILLPVCRPFLWLGLHAKWTMFTPNPPRRDIWPMVVMTMTDGTTRYWEPRPYSELTIMEKLKYKKLLKFFLRAMSAKNNKYIYRDLIDYVKESHIIKGPCQKIEIYRISHSAIKLHKFAQKRDQPKKSLIFTFYPDPKDVNHEPRYNNALVE